MKLSVSSLPPSTFAHEIAVPAERFIAVLVDLDEDDIPTKVAPKPRGRATPDRPSFAATP